MDAAIITVGDELLIGQIVNTNQAYIAEQLTLTGYDVRRMITVGDDEVAIVEALRESWSSRPLTVVTGGLGSTHDDITKKAACAFFGCGMSPSEEVREHIRALFARRNASWSDAAEGQTMVPDRARVITNPLGTAPCLHFAEGSKDLFLLPGVPHEMKAIMDDGIIPLLRRRSGRQTIRQKTLRTTGIPESVLAQRLGPVDELLENGSLAYLPSPTGVRLRIMARDPDPANAEALIARIEERIRKKAGSYIYGIGDEEIEEVLGRLLTERGLTIAVAESCTGGMIANRLTNVSGSSAYFLRGTIPYSNPAKTNLLGVAAEIIELHGAVSREVAEAMALGARTMAGTDLGISTTGIAGPTGGTPDKPVGLVWIGYSDRQETFAVKRQFGDGRLRFKERASQAALDVVRRQLLKIKE